YARQAMIKIALKYRQRLNGSHNIAPGARHVTGSSNDASAKKMTEGGYSIIKTTLQFSNYQS
ncbi:hypothetical protein QM637_15665, partial [Pantoea allii]|uniref:hypothetical protein n=1 Tax=Pantoea allii TaxID=574096 RepID=UPI0024B72B1C